MKRTRKWNDGVVAKPGGDGARFMKTPLWSRVFFCGVAVVAGVSSLWHGVIDLAAGEARVALLNEVGGASYDERFIGTGAVLIALAWMAMGAGWFATGILLWFRLEADENGRVVSHWQQRLLLGAAVAVLLAGAAIVAPGLLGVEGTSATP